MYTPAQYSRVRRRGVHERSFQVGLLRFMRLLPLTETMRETGATQNRCDASLSTETTRHGARGNAWCERDRGQTAPSGGQGVAAVYARFLYTLLYSGLFLGVLLAPSRNALCKNSRTAIGKPGPLGFRLRRYGKEFLRDAERKERIGDRARICTGCCDGNWNALIFFP